jgi:hypothetical protein
MDLAQLRNTMGFMNGIQFPLGMEIFLSTIMTNLALWPTQHPIQWIQGDLSPGAKQLEHKTYTHLHLVLRLRMCAALSSHIFTFMVLCLAQKELYLLTVKPSETVSFIFLSKRQEKS